MGSTSSKFRKALQTGDEKTAEEIYHSSQEFQKSLDPNMSYGENYQLNTPLHYASRHGMHRLIRCSLQKHSGNPNKRNTLDQTSLHCVCMEEVHRPPSSTSSYSQYYYSQPPEKKRAECLRLILGWKGIKMGSGEHEKVDVNAVDEDGNSALHYSASSGYRSLVEMLLENGASLFQENVDKETPCDCAEKNHNYDIAQLLESKMVFSQNSEDEPVGDISAIQYEESYSGMRPQELQEAKDVLVVETADMLRVPLFTAEALLRNHEWSREALLEGWMSNPTECCETSGVKPPENLGSFAAEHQLTTMDATPEDKPEVKEEKSEEEEEEDGLMCDICTGDIEIPVDTPCSHQFCKACWERYLSGKIAEGNAHNIVCPAYPCDKLVPVEIIENMVSREMSRRYLQFDIKAFVDGHPNLKWCPVAGCGRAVKLPDVETPQRETQSPTSPPPMSHAVDCGEGHIFCWNCSGDPHEPCSCENWKKWQEKKAEVKPEDLSSLDNETESASNYLWLVTNSKPCPKCNSPIQKNEGCNHMKCTKCKHDFCWVCQEPWSKHSSETGGYFRCNRFEVVQKVEEKSEALLTDAEKKNKEMQELNRFLHYYSRFKNHGHSHKLEEPLMKKAPSKMKKLACHTAQTSGGQVDTKFIEEAIQELLKARRTLKFSYPYGYYLEDRGGSKQIFEFMQNELEDSTEALSQMVARHYLRTPRHKIIQTAQLVLRKRHEFLCAVSKGFLPPETPPSSRRQTISRSWDSDSDEEDEALRRAIEVSLQEAMVQNQQQQQQQDNSEAGEDESFLPPELRNIKSHGGGGGRRRHDSGNRDPSSMTAGLLRALEMSQLLLMQQTERLNQPSSSSSQDDSLHDNQAEHAGGLTSADTTTGSGSETVIPRPVRGVRWDYSRDHTSGKTSSRHGRHSLDASITSGRSAGDVRPRSTYEDDLRRAVELSLQDTTTKHLGPSSSSQPTDQPSSSGHSARVSGHLDFDQILNDICLQDDRNSRGESRKLTGERKHKHGSPAGKGKKGKSKRGDKQQLNPWDPGHPSSSMNLSSELETEFDRIKKEIGSSKDDEKSRGGAGGGNGNGKSLDGFKKPRSISDVGKPSLMVSSPQSSSWSPSRSIGTSKKLSSGSKNYPSVRLQRVPSPNPSSQEQQHQGQRSTSDPFSVLLDSSSSHLQVQPAAVLSASAEDMHQPRLKPGRSLQRSASDRATTSSKSLVSGLLPPRKTSLTNKLEGGERREISFSFVMTSKRTCPSPKPAKSKASTESPWEFQADVAKKMAAEDAAARAKCVVQPKLSAEGLPTANAAPSSNSHRRSSLEKAGDSLISVPNTLPIHSKRSKSESPAREGARKSKSKSRRSSADKIANAAQFLGQTALGFNPELYAGDASKGHVHPRKLEKSAPLAQPELSSEGSHQQHGVSLSVSKTKGSDEGDIRGASVGETAEGMPVAGGAEGGVAIPHSLEQEDNIDNEKEESGVWQMYL